MDGNPLIIIGEVVLVPILTFFTIWVKNSNDKDVRQYNRDEAYIKSLVNRITECENRLDEKEREIKEIRVELKNRDAEYVKLYQEHTSLRAKYEVLTADHETLKKQYEATVIELTALKDAVKEDRQTTADLATKTAQTI